MDRFVRTFVGVVLLYLALMGLVGAWGYLGVVLIATGLSGMCPPYALLGICTEKKCEKESH